MSKECPEASNKILTIPNVLSLFRLCLIPVFAVLYQREKIIWAVAVLILSGLTDIADGFIARKFNMVSNLGKALDPVADKLTQGVMLVCLISKFPHMLWALLLLLVREVTDSATGIAVIKHTGNVLGAEWHGKATTVCIYAALLLHILIPGTMRKHAFGNFTVSDLAIALCMTMMAISLVLYTVRNVKALMSSPKKTLTEEN